MPNFVTKGVFGFLAGTGNATAYVLPLVLSATLPVALWFGLLPLTARGGADTSEGSFTPLSLLGVCYGTADWLNCVALLACLGCARQLHAKYGLRLLLPRRSDDRARPAVGPTLREVARQGVELMVVDVAVQLSFTLTIYTAATQSFETAYKLAAAQAAYWVVGPNYLTGLMLMLKIFGSQLIASGRHGKFERIYTLTASLTASLAVGAVVVAVLKPPPPPPPPRPPATPRSLPRSAADTRRQSSVRSPMRASSAASAVTRAVTALRASSSLSDPRSVCRWSSSSLVAA